MPDTTFTVETQRQMMALIGYDIDAGNIVHMRMDPLAIFVEIEDGIRGGALQTHEDVLTLER